MPPTSSPSRRWPYLAGLAVLVGGIAAATWLLMPWMVRIATDAAARDAFLQSLRDRGPAGAAALSGLVLLQVVVPVLPAEALEIGSGILYGAVAGGLLCLAGHTAGTVVNYLIGRYLGSRTLEIFFKPEKLEKAKALVQGARADKVVFLLYFIPGIPKDLVAYAAGLSSLPFLRYLLISLVARLPSVFSSSYIGARLAAGDTGQAVLVFVAVAVVAVPAFFLSERITVWISRGRKPPAEGRP